MTRTIVGAALLTILAAACATVPAPERVAQLRAMEAESAARLSGEGEVLFGADQQKLSGYQYCSLAVNHLERGDLRLGIRAASKALYLGQKGNDQWLLAAAKRDLAYAYDLEGYLDRSVEFADEALDLPGGSARDALRAAQREVLGDPRTNHPFFWAPFVLVGDWR